MRAVVGAPLIDDKDPDKSPKLLAKARRTIDEIEEAGEGAVRPALAPHAIYTVSEPSLRGIAEISEERDVPVADPPLRDRAGGGRLRRARPGCGRRTTSTAAACSARRRCSHTASGSIATRSS